MAPDNNTASGEYLLPCPPKKPGGFYGEMAGGAAFKDKVSGEEYVVEGPPKKPGGICCVRAPNDKTVSGEYVLACPPKKPGGNLLRIGP